MFQGGAFLGGEYGYLPLFSSEKTQMKPELFLMARFLCVGHTFSFFTVSHKIVLSGPFVVLLEWTLISLMTDQDSIFTFEEGAKKCFIHFC